MLCCAQRYSCAVEDLLFTRSVRNVIDSRVCESLSDEQIQTASLLQECIMVRDGLARLPEFFMAGDNGGILLYCFLFVHALTVFLAVYPVYD